MFQARADWKTIKHAPLPFSSMVLANRSGREARGQTFWMDRERRVLLVVDLRLFLYLFAYAPEQKEQDVTCVRLQWLQDDKEHSSSCEMDTIYWIGPFVERSFTQRSTFRMSGVDLEPMASRHILGRCRFSFSHATSMKNWKAVYVRGDLGNPHLAEVYLQS